MDEPIGKFYTKKPMSVEEVLALLNNSQYGLSALRVLISTSGINVVDIEAKLNNASYGLSALKTLIDGVRAELDNGTYGLNALKTLIDAIEDKLDITPADATFSYLNAGGEQTVFTFTPTSNSKVNTIWLDLSNLTQNTTIRLKHQIDGVTYRTFETFNWTTGMDDGLYFREVTVMNARPLRVTMQETADEGVDRDIPYYYTYEVR